MRHLSIIAFVLFMASHLNMVSQSCLPDGIVFETQADINNFQTNYPGCTEIEGDVIIGVETGSDITNLSGLSVLTSIGEYLDIEWNSTLTSLTALDNLTSFGGGLTITNNDALASLTGLDNLTSMGKYLKIENNSALTNLIGLEGLTSIGSFLSIRENDALISLYGIDNIAAASIKRLYIRSNNSLSSCEVLSVCNFLANPGGEIDIHNNATGCNSQEEVGEACESFDISESNYESSLSLYPTLHHLHHH